MDVPLVDDKLTLPPPTTNVLKLTKTRATPANDDNTSSDSDSNDDNDDESNVELWTFRVPVGLPISALEGMEIHLDDDGWQGRFHAGPEETEYQVSAGCSTENETFRVLIPTTSSDSSRRRIIDEDDSDSDDDDTTSDNKNDKEDTKAGMYLHPAPRPFRRHFNVIKAFPKRSEMDLAPLKGPEPIDPMRHSYAPVPQRAGLKRRWMPQGMLGLRVVESTTQESTSESLSRKSMTSAIATGGGKTGTSSHKQSSSKNDGTMSTTDGLKEVDVVDMPHSQGNDHEDNNTMPSRKRMKTTDLTPDDDGVSTDQLVLTKEERKAQRKAAKEAEKAAKKAEKKAQKKMKKKIKKGEASQEG